MENVQNVLYNTENRLFYKFHVINQTVGNILFYLIFNVFGYTSFVKT